MFKSFLNFIGVFCAARRSPPNGLPSRRPNVRTLVCLLLADTLTLKVTFHVILKNFKKSKIVHNFSVRIIEANVIKRKCSGIVLRAFSPKKNLSKDSLGSNVGTQTLNGN